MKKEKGCCESSIEENCCKPASAESCCQPIEAESVEEAVKRSYGQLWASQLAHKSASSRKKLASMFTAHRGLLKELKPREGMKVLDIGSGNGETVLTIAEKVKPNGKAVGVDFSPEGIELSKEKAKERELEDVAEFHLADAVELPFPDNTFDAVISECVVSLIQDKQRALREKVRVLKPGGQVIMHDVVTRTTMPKSLRENRKLYCDCVGGAVNLKEYVEMMKKAGLTNIKTDDFTKSVKKMINLDVVAKALNVKDDEAAQEIVNFARKGGVGYALLVGTKK